MTPNRFVTAVALALRPVIELPASWVVARRLRVHRRTARTLTRFGFTWLQLLRAVRQANRRR